MIAENLRVDTTFFGEKTVVLAKAGYGKSHTTRVLVEDGRALGVPFIIIDPQEAYKNLPGFDYIDAENIKQPDALGKLLAVTNKNVVISTKGMLVGEQNVFLKKLLESYRRHQRKGIKTLVIDEAHKFAPEGKSTVAKETILSMVQEDRSDGLGVIIIDQRPARISKTIIAQANNVFIGRFDAMADLNAVKGNLRSKKEIDTLTKLEVGEFFALGLTQGPIKVRKSKTKHSGNAPKNLLNENERVYNELIDKLKSRKRFLGVESDSDGKEPMTKELLKDVVPSQETFMGLVGKGASMSLGLGLSTLAGRMAARIPSPLPVVSSRTVGSGVAMVGLFATSRMLPQRGMFMRQAKRVTEFATAGSAVNFAGSLTADVMAAAGVSMPPLLEGLFSAATGVSMMNVEAAPQAELQPQV